MPGLTLAPPRRHRPRGGGQEVLRVSDALRAAVSRIVAPDDILDSHTSVFRTLLARWVPATPVQASYL